MFNGLSVLSIFPADDIFELWRVYLDMKLLSSDEQQHSFVWLVLAPQKIFAFKDYPLKHQAAALANMKWSFQMFHKIFLNFEKPLHIEVVRLSFDGVFASKRISSLWLVIAGEVGLSRYCELQRFLTSASSSRYRFHIACTRLTSIYKRSISRAEETIFWKRYECIRKRASITDQKSHSTSSSSVCLASSQRDGIHGCPQS